LLAWTARDRPPEESRKVETNIIAEDDPKRQRPQDPSLDLTFEGRLKELVPRRVVEELARLGLLVQDGGPPGQRSVVVEQLPRDVRQTNLVGHPSWPGA
jgi:hypothetical protein